MIQGKPKIGENAIKISYDFQLAFFLIQHPLDDCSPQFWQCWFWQFLLFFKKYISKAPTRSGTWNCLFFHFSDISLIVVYFFPQEEALGWILMQDLKNYSLCSKYQPDACSNKWDFIGMVMLICLGIMFGIFPAAKMLLLLLLSRFSRVQLCATP